MTTLTTSLSLLQHATDLSPQYARAVELMADELTRFRRALEDLLALGRLDAGADAASVSMVGARELVRQALLADGRSAELLLGEPEGAQDPVVAVDRSQLLRALTNLFRNADLHGGGLTGVRVGDGGPFVDIHVEDRGPGVAAGGPEAGLRAVRASRRAEGRHRQRPRSQHRRADSAQPRRRRLVHGPTRRRRGVRAAAADQLRRERRDRAVGPGAWASSRPWRS